jgi:YesN/AraC family two-component response regulator
LTLGFYKEQVKVYQPSPFINERKEKEEWFLELKRYYQEFYKKTGKEQYDYLKEILEYIAKEQACFIKDLLAFCKECVDVIYVRYIEDNSDVIKDILLKTKKNIDEASSFSELKKIVLDYAYSNIWSDEFEEKKLSHNVYKAVIYIRQHYNEPLSLEQIASEVNLNPEYLSRIFKDETGQTYSGYLSNIRMNKAENLLLHSTEKVQKIAETVGYTNVSYFSTIFKKRYGVNPYEFRRNHEKSYHDFN